MDQALVGAINSSARTLGLVVSGLWIAYTFRKLQKTREAEIGIQRSVAETEKARADSEKALADARKSAAERDELSRVQLSQQPNLYVDFSEVAENRPVDGRVILAVTVDIRNLGSRNMRLEFKSSAVTLGKLDPTDNELRRMLYVKRVMPTRMHASESTLYDIDYRIFRVGQNRHLTFLMPGDSPGLHILEFSAEYFDIPFDRETIGSDRRRISAIQQKIINISGSDLARGSESS